MIGKAALPIHPYSRGKLRYGMGTLFFLMALFAVWLQWELTYIRARQGFLGEIYHARWRDGPGVFKITASATVKDASIPWWRSLLGDKPVDYIVLGEFSPTDELTTARELLPEAQVFRQVRGRVIAQP